MIDRATTETGDYVTVTSTFQDYGIIGTIFKIIDTKIPDEPTAAVAWMIDEANGMVKGGKPYKLPMDKVSPMDRSHLASILTKTLKSLNAEVTAAERKRDVLRAQVADLQEYQDKNYAKKSFLDKLFNFC